MHAYILEPYKGPYTRYSCPKCDEPRVFVRYIHQETGAYLGHDVGRCNREVKCGYHKPPRQYFIEHGYLECSSRYTCERYPPRSQARTAPLPEPNPISLIPIDLFQQSLHAYDHNQFVRYLEARFGRERTQEVVARYFLGTSYHRFRSREYPGYESPGGAVIFYQIDGRGRVRAGKVMLYDPQTGKRVKVPFNHVTWVHAIRRLPGYQLRQCNFGEHLLKEDPTKIVAIVESEKTAVIASIYLPEFVWLACGSRTGLTEERFKVLKGRKVVLFPDLGAYERWCQKARELSHLARMEVSDLLERKATEMERASGWDLADYLLRLPLSEFQPEPLRFQIEDVVELMGATHTGKDFGGIIVQGVKTSDGKCYDLLFDAAGELIEPGRMEGAVACLEVYFEKRLVRSYFNDIPCLLHVCGK